MRHKKSFNHLGRKTGHRKAMLSNMASSLIMHKRIETTTAKAKALKRYIEPLITRSKDDSTHSRRVVFSYLQDKEAVAELFREVGAKVADRPGGYTRIIRLGNRLGDNADMCMMELVDFNENLLAEKASAKKSTSRRRRGGSKSKTDAPKVESAAKEATEEAPVAEAVVEEAVVEEVAAEEVAEEPLAEAPVEEAPVAEAVVEEPQVEAPAEEAAPSEKSEEAEAQAQEPEEEKKEDEDTDKKDL
jgi:large subunit ribosomal protein L17